MKKPHRRNEAVLKRKGEKRLARARIRRARNKSLGLLPFKQWQEREQAVRDRMASKERR